MNLLAAPFLFRGRGSARGVGRRRFAGGRATPAGSTAARFRDGLGASGRSFCCGWGACAPGRGSGGRRGGGKGRCCGGGGGCGGGRCFSSSQVVEVGAPRVADAPGATRVGAGTLLVVANVTAGLRGGKGSGGLGAGGWETGCGRERAGCAGGCGAR
eukprot:scaffold7315_cov103-Isochrysis_galbana.AAC.2